jgi:serine/threonine protein kinase
MGDRDLKREVTLDSILSDDTYHGVIYRGLFRGVHKVVVKKVLLDTGLHFDLREGRHHAGVKGPVMSSREALSAFRQVPRDGELFLERRPVPRAKFRREVHSMKRLYREGVGPKVYGSWTERASSVSVPHFAYLVLEECDSTGKQILLKRKFTATEKARVAAAIRRLHNKIQCLHGDLKPSNMGVMLRDGEIKSILWLDAGGLRQRDKLTKAKFRALAAKEAHRFQEHALKNMKHRQA